MNYLFTNENQPVRKLEDFNRFPRQLVANLEVWVNPLVKFIWVGSLLFFFSGLLILLPIGESRS